MQKMLRCSGFNYFFLGLRRLHASMYVEVCQQLLDELHAEGGICVVEKEQADRSLLELLELGC